MFTKTELITALAITALISRSCRTYILSGKHFANNQIISIFALQSLLLFLGNKINEK